MDTTPDVKAMTNEKLEEILRSAQNTNVPGSLYNRAKNEFELRKEYAQTESRDELHTTLDNHLVRINQTLDYIYKKPRRAAVYAVVSAILIGVFIAVLSAYIIKLLHLT